MSFPVRRRGAADVVILTSGSVRARLRVFLSKHFFRYSFDYRQEWLRFTGTLSAEDDELPFRRRAIQAIGELVESPGGLLWVRERDGVSRSTGCSIWASPTTPRNRRTARWSRFSPAPAG